MIGCLRMTLDECEDAYMTMAEKIFVPKRKKLDPRRWVDFIQADERFDSRCMEQVLKDIIKQKTKDPHFKLKRETEPDACKV